MKNNQIMIGLLILTVVILGFLGGTIYQSSKVRTVGNANFRGQFIQTGNGRGMMANRGGQILGEVLSLDSNSFTVKLSDGSTKIILLTSGSSISKSEPARFEDLSIGEKIAVFGQTNPDGSVTAASIQLNPVVRIASPSSDLK